jgi:hypothetical protein
VRLTVGQVVPTPARVPQLALQVEHMFDTVCCADCRRDIPPVAGSGRGAGLRGDGARQRAHRPRPLSVSRFRLRAGAHLAGQNIWCVFLCATHRAAVLLAEPLDKVAVAELHDREEQHRLAMAGQSFRRPAPLQCSRG